jgi:ABC-2 type transport system permease protein
MYNLIQFELVKIFRKPRTYISFLVVFLIIIAFFFGMFYEGEKLISFVTQNLEANFQLEGKIINVYLLSYLLMNILWIHIPILICLVTGDLIAGEASKGTLRLIMTRPYSRFQIYLSKYIAGFIYTIMLILFMFLLSFGLGALLFGEGDLIVIRKLINIFSSDDVIWRFAYAYGFGILSMLVVASLSFMISSFTKNAIGPIVGTIAILIGLNVITALGMSVLSPIAPYLFNVHFAKWQYFFDFDIEWNKLYQAVIVQLVYIFLFFFIGFYNFNKKDIHT